MNFSLVPIADKKFLNFIYLGLGSKGKSLIALFNTRGNTMIKESVAKDLDIEMIDKDYIDEKKTYKRAFLDELLIGGLKLNRVPVLIGKDSVFDIGHDPMGNTNDCDMVLGWNIISQFAWRGNLAEGRFEVQTSDFTKPSGKKTNQPILNIGLGDKIIKAAIDSSRPLTIVSESIGKEVVAADPDLAKTMDMMGESSDDIAYLNRFSFKIDNKDVKIQSVSIDADLNDAKIQVVFGADLLRQTKWSIYGPSAFIKLENY